MAEGREPKRCQICHSTSPQGRWSEEDVLPKWLRKRMLEQIRGLPADALPANWQPERRDVVHPVCEACNGRLNEMFEIPAIDLIKEIVDGSIIELTPRQQVVLAGWFVKTDILFEFARKVRYRGGRPGPPEPQRDESFRLDLLGMLEDGTPPANSTARIAYVSPIALPTPEPLVPPRWVNPTLYRLTSVHALPRIVSETVLWGVDPVPFIDATKHDDRFICIWPPQITKVRWPPSGLLGNADILGLRAAWRHHPDNIVGNLLPPEIRRPRTPASENDLTADSQPNRS